VVKHLDVIARRMRDEDTPGFGIECAVVELAAESVRYVHNAD